MTNYEILKKEPTRLGEILRLSKYDWSQVQGEIREILRVATAEGILLKTQEELADILAVNHYLSCRSRKCVLCSKTCEAAKRSELAHHKYNDLKRKFFANPVIAERRKVEDELFLQRCKKAGKGKFVPFGYAGTTEKEFRDTIPSELWLAMTITVGDCRKEFLKWLKQPAEYKPSGHNEGDGKS